jgi:hypothetical protein
VDPELTALTSTAATAVVKLLATAAWEQATSAVGRLWHRVHPERVEMVQAELAEGRTEVLADADAPQGTTITMQATAFDTSRVNQAGRDLHITTGE